MKDLAMVIFGGLLTAHLVYLLVRICLAVSKNRRYE